MEGIEAHKHLGDNPRCAPPWSVLISPLSTQNNAATDYCTAFSLVPPLLDNGVNAYAFSTELNLSRDHRLLLQDLSSSMLKLKSPEASY